MCAARHGTGTGTYVIKGRNGRYEVVDVTRWIYQPGAGIVPVEGIDVWGVTHAIRPALEQGCGSIVREVPGRPVARLRAELVEAVDALTAAIAELARPDGAGSDGAEEPNHSTPQFGFDDPTVVTRGA